MITTIDATKPDQEEPVSTPNTQGLDEKKMAALQRLIDGRDQLPPEQRAAVEAMAEKHKLPMRPVTGFVEQANPTKENMSAMGEMAKVSALPMAGQLAGGVAGSFLGPAGNIAGQSIGAVGGLMANKMLGISNPDSTDAAITGAAPFLGKGLTVAGRRAIPGAEAAEQQIGAEMMRGSFKRDPGLKAATTAAYERVEQLGSPDMPVPNFTSTVTDLFATEKIAKKYGGAAPQIRKALLDAGQTMQAQNGTMPFRDVEVMLKRYRQKTSALEAQGGEIWGAYKDLRKALFDDMNAAISSGHATSQNAVAMKEAIAASKKQIAHDELAELVEKYGTKSVTVNGQTFEVIEPTKLINKLKDLDFAASAGAVEAKKVEQTLKQLAAIPKVDMNTGTGVGTAGRAWAMAGAAAAGGAFGQSVTAGLGGAAAAYGAIKLHDAVASLAMSDWGRNALVKVFKANKGGMGERTSQVLQFLATQLEDTGEAAPSQPQQTSKFTGLPTAEEEALQGPDVTPGDIASPLKLAGAKGIAAGGLMLGTIGSSTSSRLNGRITNLKDWLKKNPNAASNERDAAVQMLREAQSELNENRSFRRSQR